MWNSLDPAPSYNGTSVGGFIVSRACSSVIPAHSNYITLSQLCSNASDPNAIGSAGYCFWGSIPGVDCVPCPTGALCPGGYRLWSLPSYYVPSESSTATPTKCLYPSMSRCTGWSFVLGTTTCGTGYMQGIYYYH
jgi:hypothetical protein